MVNPIQNTIDQWEDKKRVDSPPFRYDFEDIDENVQFLLSYNSQTGHKIRCSGLFFDGLIGTSVVGRTIESLFEPEHQSRVIAAVERVFIGPAIVKLHIQTADQPVEIVLLPIRAEHGPVEYAFGAVKLLSMPEFASPRIGLLNTTIEELRDAPSNAVGFAEGRTPFLHGTAPKASAPKLKVIDGDQRSSGFVKKSVFKLIQNIKREP